jgi:dTDP-D-glucose 4,6-dehydratase
LKRDFNYKPKIPLNEAMDRTMKWFNQNLKIEEKKDNKLKTE